MEAWADAERHERRQDRERRHAETSVIERGEHDRRRSLRRRAQLRNLIFTAMTLSVAPGTQGEPAGAPSCHACSRRAS
jgi:hypothetical protein